MAWNQRRREVRVPGKMVPRGHRDLTAAALAVHEHPLGQPCLGRLAARAAESSRPPQLREALPTGILRREPAVEFCQRARVLGVGHTVTLPVAATSGKAKAHSTPPPPPPPHPAPPPHRGPHRLPHTRL